MTNAERFLNAYAQCEKKLAELAEQPKYIPFSQLVARCANRSRVVALNQQSLREYNELRNAIVHIRGSEKEIIAEPCDSVTEDIERIAKLLTEPHDILKYASMPVKTIHIDTSIRDAFHLMQEMDTSKVPVYKGQNFVGMITLDEIAKVAMQGKTDDTVVSDVLSSTKNSRVVFTSKSNNVDIVLRYFDKAREEGITLLAILITESGKHSEKPIGIITTSDLPNILKIYA